MKVAVSASGRDLDTMMDLRFGRCGYFIIVETDDMSFDVFDNENMAQGEDAGIQSAQFIAFKGIKVVITANIGTKAARTLSSAGVQLITGQKGTVREAIEDYKEGKLKITDEVSGSKDDGMGRRAGLGRGRGRGMGRGRGR